MTQDQLETIVDHQIVKIVKTLKEKGKEYANEDVLHNFKEAVKEFGETEAITCWGYLKKHLVSIKDIAYGKDTTTALIDEKIGDAIVYLILMKAILLERLHKQLEYQKQYGKLE